MTRKHLLGLALMSALGAGLSSQTFAQLHLEIVKTAAENPKIAIVPFSSDSSIYPIVENDLNRSGRFTSASQNLPATASINKIQAGDWQNAGVPYVVVGQIKNIDANTFEIHYQLYDVQKQQYLLNEVLTVPSNRVRQAGHMISDAIYQALTGIAGDFSGRIAYVLRNPETPAQRYTLQIADTDGEITNLGMIDILKEFKEQVSDEDITEDNSDIEDETSEIIDLQETNVDLNK